MIEATLLGLCYLVPVLLVIFLLAGFYILLIKWFDWVAIPIAIVIVMLPCAYVIGKKK